MGVRSQTLRYNKAWFLVSSLSSFSLLELELELNGNNRIFLPNCHSLNTQFLHTYVYNIYTLTSSSSSTPIQTPYKTKQQHQQQKVTELRETLTMCLAAEKATKLQKRKEWKFQLIWHANLRRKLQFLFGGKKKKKVKFSGNKHGLRVSEFSI